MTLSFSTDLETFILDVRERAVAARAPEAMIAKLDEVLEWQDLEDALRKVENDLDEMQECRDDLAGALQELLDFPENVEEAQAALKRSGPQR